MPLKTTRYIVILLIAVLLAACGGGEQTAPEAAGPAATDVSILLSWTHANEFAGFYAAAEEGYYAEEGLNVDIREGGYDADGNYLDPVAAVKNGDADFGIIDSTVILSERAAGATLVGVMTIYQRHPLAFTSLAENNIVRPADLVGKTVDVSYTSSVVYQALLNDAGIDLADVNTTERTDFTTGALLAGDVDVIDAWVTNEVVTLAREGQEFNMILPSDYGIDVYPNVIFTTEDMIANNPEAVQAFVSATIKGMQYTVDNPDAALDLTMQYNDSLDRTDEEEAIQRGLPLVNPAGVQVGTMNPEVWEISRDILVEQGLLSEDVNVEEAYTLQFLNEVYAD